MLKKDEIIDPCLKYIPRHDKYSFNKALEEEDSPLIAKLRNKLSSYLPNNSPTPSPAKTPQHSEIDHKAVKQSKFYKEYHQELYALELKKYAVVGISLIPVLLYKKMPLLKDNTQWSIRAFLSFAMLYFPYSYYDRKFVQKDVREIKDRYYHKYGHNYKNYLLTNDERYLNP